MIKAFHGVIVLKKDTGHSTRAKVELGNGSPERNKGTQGVINMQVKMKDGTIYQNISRLEDIGNNKISMSWDDGSYHEVERTKMEKSGPDEQGNPGSD